MTSFYSNSSMRVFIEFVDLILILFKISNNSINVKIYYLTIITKNSKLGFITYPKLLKMNKVKIIIKRKLS